MSKLTKDEVAQWIRNIIPYVENPIYLVPKTCLKGQINLQPGKIIEYDASLMPTVPKIITQTENLKALIELYKACEEGQMTTNYEKIKNMTIEEMANRFIPFNGKSYLGLNGQMYKERNEALKTNIEWLESESEE